MPVLESEGSRRTEKVSLTLVGGFAGAGKSEFTRLLSGLTGWAILDKDTLTNPLLEQLLLALGLDPGDRQSALYETKVKPYAYECLMNAAWENLAGGVSTILSAPFLSKIDDPVWLRQLQDHCAEANAVLTVVWIKSDAETMLIRLRSRGAGRDNWKLAHWEKYLATIDLDREPNFAHSTVDNRLSAEVSLEDQAYEVALRLRSVL